MTPVISTQHLDCINSFIRGVGLFPRIEPSVFPAAALGRESCFFRCSPYLNGNVHGTTTMNMFLSNIFTPDGPVGPIAQGR